MDAAGHFTFEDLVDTERDMLMHAEEKYGAYFIHAKGMVAVMNNLIGTIVKPDRFLFVLFLSAVKKHLTLALFSMVRRHHVQGGMNLRQVLENSAWGAYALVHENIDLFQTQGPNGRVEIPKRLAEARDAWMAANYTKKSDEILLLKKQINRSVAHGNIVYASQTFGLGSTDVHTFATPFFDLEDDFRIETDLLMVANFGMGMIDLFIEVNQQENVFALPDGFDEAFGELVAEHGRLREEIRNHPRFIGLTPEM